MMNTLAKILACAALLSTPALAVPALLNHQGRMAVNGVNFDGTGQFKFALVNSTGSVTYWSNDGTSLAGSAPATAVSLSVNKGLYSVLLGDASLANMAAVPPTVFDNDDVRLRVWFNDGTNGFELITPDQRLAAAPYALSASTADQVLLSNLVAPPLKQIISWGYNSAGQTVAPSLTNASIAAIAAGASYSLALLKDGTVVTWGAPMVLPSGLNNVTQIAAGAEHGLARRSNGSVEAWGSNSYGQASVPNGITTALKVAAGGKHSLVLLENGNLMAWGDNTFGQTSIPNAATNIIAIACGYDHSLALTSSGTVIGWGRDDTGQASTPSGLVNVVAIAAGAYHSLALKSDGTVVAWGWNLGGQTNLPPGLSDVAQVAGGYSFSIALKTDGTVVAWGNDANSQTSIPTTATQITSIAAGASHALALRADLVSAPVARLDQDNIFSGKIGIRRAPLTNTLEVDGNASKTTAGNWLANSDGRIKTDVASITGALDKLDQVRLVDFRYTDDYRAKHGIEDKRYLNVIAQEFAKLFPNNVKSSGETLPDGSAILQVDTYPLTIYSAAAVQELHKENKALKQKLTEQEQRLQKLEAALNLK